MGNRTTVKDLEEELQELRDKHNDLVDEFFDFKVRAFQELDHVVLIPLTMFMLIVSTIVCGLWLVQAIKHVENEWEIVDQAKYEQLLEEQKECQQENTQGNSPSQELKQTMCFSF